MSTIKVVVCDDDFKTLRDLRIVCNTNISKIIKEFNNGYDLLQWIKQNPNEADLIILDIILPNIDGFVIFHEIQNINKNIPIIIVSIENSTTLIKYMALNGVKDYITKPYDLDQLKRRVLKLLEKVKIM